MQCGLLGRKLGHSYSPQIHRHLGDYSYTLFEKEPGELSQFLKNGSFNAINVTIPYKKDVLPHCSELSEIAQQLGSVNTIVRKSDGTLIGHNTDYFGFLSMVEQSGLIVKNKKVLVLGSGGASITVCAVLEKLGAHVIVISRSGENNYENIHKHSNAAVIVNTTPVGMYPNNGQSPVSLEHFPQLEGVLDLIYNPAKTALLIQAEHRGVVAVNGLWMLIAQAKESAEWFLGKPLSNELIPKIHSQLEQQMKNIILVGMPGSGKTTVGKLLAAAMQKSFVDSDEQIQLQAGISIPEIFARSGESGFRKLETQVLEQLGKGSAQVIATGGGCVTRPENLTLLRQNGTIYWLKRDISQLPIDGRPLSQKGSLEKMYRIRMPMYSTFSDHIIDNNTMPQDAADIIIKLEGLL